jgi:DNA-binding MarR family transcriptional regulator
MSSIMRKQVDKVNHPGQDPEDDVLELVHGVMHQFRSQQYQVLREGPHDVTHMESKVMSFFAHHPGATQTELAQHSGRDKAQLARLVKGLRERGLLEGDPDDADRRSVHLRLTTGGHAVQRALQQQGRKLRAQAVAGFSAAERQQLLALLQRMQRNLASSS